MGKYFYDPYDGKIKQLVEKIDSYTLSNEIQLPRFEIPNKFIVLDSEDSKLGENNYLRHLTLEGAKKRYKKLNNETKERIDFELKVIENTGYPGYFLIVQDFISSAKKMGVSVGPGRGSAAGSVVAYCLGITNIDPIKYDLLFERFLNPERVTMPDIDIDFDDEGRSKVIEYVIQKYGAKQVAQIITYGTMAAKSSIRDTARVLDLPLADADRVAKLVHDGVEPERLFMCLGYTDSKFLTDIKVTNELAGAGEGFDLINVNLNEKTDGADLYLYTSNTRMEVNPLKTAFFYQRDKKLYFFGGPDGKYYYIFQPKEGKVTSAELISNKFGKLPYGLNAAFVWNYDEKTYFFKGKFVYRYNYKTSSIEDGYPKTIAREFKGVPNNIDAVFSWDKDGNTYFFKDKFLFKYDTKKKRVANGYPRLIKARFPGAPEKVDAVYYNTNDNETYFIRANDYFILDTSEKVKSGYPKKLNLKYPGLGLLPTVNTFFTQLGVDSKMYFFGNDKYFKLEIV